jgi:hypothetical protein
MLFLLIMTCELSIVYSTQYILPHALTGCWLVSFSSDADEENSPESPLRLVYVGSFSPSSTEEERIFQHASTLQGIMILWHGIVHFLYCLTVGNVVKTTKDAA